MTQAPQDLVDPNVKVPAAVKAAAARSEQFYSKNEDDKEIPIDGSEVGQPAKTEDESKTEPKQKGAEEPKTPAKDTSDATPKGDDKHQEDDWEHRYNSMKGRYERAQGDLRSQAERITHLENVLASIEVRTLPKDDKAQEQPASLITPELEEEWGKEFFEAVDKKAREIYSSETAALNRKVQELETQLGKVGGYVAGDARSRMLSELDSKVPNWKELNTDDNFISWLQLPDTYSGAIRHELLKAAFERNDSPRVAAFFQGFLAEEAAMAPADRGPDLGEDLPSEQGRKTPKVPLERLAAPGRAKSAAATAPAEKPIISRAQISRFYSDIAAGKYHGKEEEQNRLEKMIFEAQGDGRIR